MVIYCGIFITLAPTVIFPALHFLRKVLRQALLIHTLLNCPSVSWLAYLFNGYLNVSIEMVVNRFITISINFQNKFVFLERFCENKYIVPFFSSDILVILHVVGHSHRHVLLGYPYNLYKLHETVESVVLHDQLKI
jgi:hypothetical protein